MRILSNNNIELMETLISANQFRTKKIMSKFLKKLYPKVLETEEYIIAEGDIPIGLVAHMDTVFELEILKGERELFYDTRKNVMYSPGGAGFDDKAGVFAIIQILRSGLRPHIILTTDEEVGAKGAVALAKLEKPFKDLRYLIQLDRRGSNDCVFYECDNEDFVGYVEKFGFVWNYGSFSDISELCPAWKVAGVNLSIGYRDEHTESEVLFVGQMLSTIDKVKTMLKEKEIPYFEYIPSKYYSYLKNFTFDYAYEGLLQCNSCGKHFMEEEMYPVVKQDETTVFYCIDCLVEKVGWCRECGNAYELYSPEAPKEGLCPICQKENFNGDKTNTKNI